MNLDFSLISRIIIFLTIQQEDTIIEYRQYGDVFLFRHRLGDSWQTYVGKVVRHDLVHDCHKRGCHCDPIHYEMLTGITSAFYIAGEEY